LCTLCLSKKAELDWYTWTLLSTLPFTAVPTSHMHAACWRAILDSMPAAACTLDTVTAYNDVLSLDDCHSTAVQDCTQAA